jgi:hypothetical protein
VIGWMPAAALYFRAPDGHLLEYLAMLEEDPKPDLQRIAVILTHTRHACMNG